MSNYLNTQVDSAIANLLVPPNDIDPDYHVYTSSYASGDIIQPIPNTERRVTMKLELGINSKPAKPETVIPLLGAIKTSRTTSVAVGPRLQPLISQQNRSSEKKAPVLFSDAIPQSAQIDSIQLPSTESSPCQLQNSKDCECTGECSDADWWCQKLDSLNAQVAVMIQEGALAISREPPSSIRELSSTTV